jgi:hypothetical protein
MAITTLTGLLAGMRPLINFNKQMQTSSLPNVSSTWGQGTTPAAGAFNTTLNGVTLSSPVTGQIPFTNPASGNAYLARLEAASVSTSTTLILADRLWHNGGINITSTSAQGITSPTWPARDANGATSGEGVFIALEVSSVAGGATPTVTISYTNQAGTAGKTSSIVGNSNAGGSLFYRFPLESGDTGVQSVQSITLSTSWVSGTINLVAFRGIAALPMPFANKVYALDAINAAMPRLFSGSVPFFLMACSSSNTRVQGSIAFTEG